MDSISIWSETKTQAGISTYERLPAERQLRIRTGPSETRDQVLDWIEAAKEELLHLSVLTLGEIRKGLAMLPQGRRRTRLESWLNVELQNRFSGRILPIDSAVADRWGMLSANARRRGLVIPVIDGLIAATALQHNLTVASRNTGDFTAAQVPVLNPWEA